MTKQPWNKNKIIGQKAPFTPMQIKALRRKLKDELLDLTLFNFVIDTMLRCSDVLKIKVGDVIDYKGNVKDSIILKQKKTSRGLQVLISPTTKELIKSLIRKEDKFENHYLFTSSRSGKDKPMSDRYYRKLVKKWAEMIDLDPAYYSTHSLRRTIPSIIYKHEKQEKGSMESILEIKEMLGHSSIESTIRYLNVKQEEALEARKKWMI
jgi:integrase